MLGYIPMCAGMYGCSLNAVWMAATSLEVQMMCW